MHNESKKHSPHPLVSVHVPSPGCLRHTIKLTQMLVVLFCELSRPRDNVPEPSSEGKCRRNCCHRVLRHTAETLGCVAANTSFALSINRVPPRPSSLCDVNLSLNRCRLMRVFFPLAVCVCVPTHGMHQPSDGGEGGAKWFDK